MINIKTSFWFNYDNGVPKVIENLSNIPFNYKLPKGVTKKKEKKKTAFLR